MGLDTETTWRNALTGVSGITEVNEDVDREQIKTWVAGYVKGYDPSLTIDVRELRHMDRFAQLGVTATFEAVKNARLDTQNSKDSFRIGVSIGSGVGGIETTRSGVLTPMRRLSPFIIPQMTIDSTASTVTRFLGIRGPSYGLTSACATGGDAIFNACQMLNNGTCDVVLAGGSEAPISAFTIASFNACRALVTKFNDRPQESSRPFDAKRDGFVMAEAGATLVLETLDHARERGANIIATLAGCSSTTDAYHVTRPHPEGLGAVRAIELAMDSAGLPMTAIDYINAHGTSTYWNDLIETKAIKSTLGKHAYKTKISATKSMTGHMLGATGVAETAFCALAIRDSKIPPTINLQYPDPECDLDYTPNSSVNGEVNVAISNSFGFGGHNTCIVVTKFEG